MHQGFKKVVPRCCLTVLNDPRLLAAHIRSDHIDHYDSYYYGMDLSNLLDNLNIKEYHGQCYPKIPENIDGWESIYHLPYFRSSSSRSWDHDGGEFPSIIRSIYTHQPSDYFKSVEFWRGGDTVAKSVYLEQYEWTEVNLIDDDEWLDIKVTMNNDETPDLTIKGFNVHTNIETFLSIVDEYHVHPYHT